MIVARGLGRRVTGASGIIVAAGLGLVLIQGGGGGSIPQLPPMESAQQQAVSQFRRVLDEVDLLDIVPIVVEVLNGRR